MDFMGFGGGGLLAERGCPNRADLASSVADFEGLGTILHNARLRRDIARRSDLVRFVRDEAA